MLRMREFLDMKTPWRIIQSASVVVLVGAAFVATDGFGTRALVVNTTNSLPRGLYVRTFDDVQRGSIVRIPLPERMNDYLAHWPEWHAWLTKGGLLKPVVGASGDVVCRRKNEFLVNGRVLGTALTIGPDDRPLPAWVGCKTLGSDQIAVFSDRIPDSMDSREFGPVPVETAKTYRLVWGF